MAVLVSDWRGGKLPRATAIMILRSKWWSRSSSALAMAAGGSAVLAGGEATHAGPTVASAGQMRLLRFRGCTAKASKAHGEATGSQVAGRDIPVATATVTTARRAGDLWGSSGVVMAWLRLCAWCVCS